MDFAPGTSPGESHSVGDKTWIWDGEKWTLVASPGSGTQVPYTFTPPLIDNRHVVSFVWSSMSNL